jgi:outer membrane lipopolysaccharide assembly protein LptE/RlpB
MRTMIAVLMLSMLCGCSFDSRNTTPVETRVPKIAIPARPQLEKLAADEVQAYAALPAALRAKLEGNDLKLKEYAGELEVSVRVYNAYADVQNQKSNAWIGIPPTEAVPTNGGK